MMSGGIWMLDESKRSLAFVIFYRFYSMAFPVYCASMATSLAIEIPNLISESSTAVMENVARALVVAIVVTKLVMCKKKRIVDLFEAASKQFAEIAGNADPEIIKILQQHVEYWKKILLVLVVPVIFGYLLLCEMGIENTIRFDWLSKPPNVSLNAPLPSNFWYPFDKNAYHHWLLLDQCLRVGGITTGMNSVAAMINSLMVFMRLQIKLLQHHFRNFDKYGGGPEDLRWCDGGGTSKLRLLCRRHQELIAYVEKFNEALKYIILLEYTSSSIMFAGAIFQIVSGEKVVFAFFFMVFNYAQLMTFSWNCNEILTESAELATALFESDWYLSNPETKTLILIMMVRSQRPLILTVGPFGSMTLEAGMSVSYSYASVMATSSE
ncbi:odorant receptor 30a-like isoform X4 [Cylas formicarius]|uniref:odorant receptor 30a-like isoform X4 n=1 Tax=Cylas formicarius TaxID=197179 RepID=UPI002958C568|nr:odorant receptor 30a-like isoform X4 [Cylas formicarius]